MKCLLELFIKLGYVISGTYQQPNQPNVNATPFRHMAVEKSLLDCMTSIPMDSQAEMHKLIYS